MAINVKAAATVAEKWSSRAGGAGGDYQKGVQNPKRDWATATVAAASSYAGGVQQAISDGRFSKGVQKAGSDKWAAKAANVGASRFTQGVGQSKGDYQDGVAPYLEALRGITLPPRMPKGDPSNVQRVAAVMSTMRATKVKGV